MAPARVAIVGTGNIARVHTAALTSLPREADVVAAADVGRARLAAFGAEHDIPGQYEDLGELLHEAKPDLVHLCTPLGCIARRRSAACERAPQSSRRNRPR